MESCSAANTREYRSVLFLSRRNTVYTEAVKDVQAWFLRNRIHHAPPREGEQPHLSSLDSATWKRGYIQPLRFPVEGLSAHAKKYRPAGHRGSGSEGLHHCWLQGTAGFLKAHDFPISLIEDPARPRSGSSRESSHNHKSSSVASPDREKLPKQLQGATPTTRVFWTSPRPFRPGSKTS